MANEWQALMDRLLAKAPSSRPADATAVAEELSRIELMETALDESGYGTALWLLPGARRHRANVVKALALARDYLTEDGYDIVSIPEFVDVEIDGNIRTAIRLSVVSR